jgi:dTDP-4-amino-4,6-dideoxygalactose transaminase
MAAGKRLDTMTRIFLSPPHVGNDERRLLLDALDSNWVAPLGPHVDQFEREMAARAGVPYAAALSSGTAGLHLALKLIGVGPGDEVLVPSLTFVATANAVVYVGARPIFVDADAGTWTVDTDLVAEELERRSRQGKLPAAVVSVDLYGQCADYDPLLAVCAAHNVPLIEDAAEALGGSYRGKPAGSFGAAAVFSFNGNKIITTSGGGMLVSRDEHLVERARYLATQAREPWPHYEHVETGYNYRLSNLLAAVGRAQLLTLDERVQRRREVNRGYRQLLGDLPGIEFMPLADYGESSCWLTCILVDPGAFGCDREAIRLACEELDIETRPTWKPMHLQPLFAGVPMVGGSVSASIFERGLCLPSGSALTDGQVEQVAAAIRGLRR